MDLERFIELTTGLVGLGWILFLIFRLKKFHWDASRARSKIYQEPIRPIDKMMPAPPAPKSHNSLADVAYRRFFWRSAWSVAMDVTVALIIIRFLPDLVL